MHEKVFPEGIQGLCNRVGAALISPTPMDKEMRTFLFSVWAISIKHAQKLSPENHLPTKEVWSMKSTVNK